MPSENGTVDGEADETGAGTASGSDNDSAAAVAGASEQAEPPEEDEGVRPIPDRLVTELTAHRTLAMRLRAIRMSPSSGRCTCFA